MDVFVIGMKKSTFFCRFIANKTANMLQKKKKNTDNTTGELLKQQNDSRGCS